MRLYTQFMLENYPHEIDDLDEFIGELEQYDSYAEITLDRMNNKWKIFDDFGHLYEFDIWTKIQIMKAK